MMQKILIETTPEDLTDLILSGIKKEFEKLLNGKFSNQEEEEFLTKDEACELLKCCSTTLWNWEKKKILTPNRKGRLVRYKKSDVINFKK